MQNANMNTWNFKGPKKKKKKKKEWNQTIGLKYAFATRVFFSILWGRWTWRSSTRRLCQIQFRVLGFRNIYIFWKHAIFWQHEDLLSKSSDFKRKNHWNMGSFFPQKNLVYESKICHKKKTYCLNLQISKEKSLKHASFFPKKVLCMSPKFAANENVVHKW